MGLVAACLTFIYRISSLTRAEAVPLPVPAREVQAWRLHGALFFGAVRLVENLEDHLPERALVLDLEHLIYMDSSGADTLSDLHRECGRGGVRLLLCGLAHQPLDICRRTGLLGRLGPQGVQPDLAAALADVTITPDAGGVAPAASAASAPPGGQVG